MNKARLTAYGWQIFFTLQSIGIVPPVVMFYLKGRAIEDKQARRKYWRKLIIIGGLAYLAYNVIVYILIAYGVIKIPVK